MAKAIVNVRVAVIFPQQQSDQPLLMIHTQVYRPHVHDSFSERLVQQNTQRHYNLYNMPTINMRSLSCTLPLIDDNMKYITNICPYI